MEVKKKISYKASNNLNLSSISVALFATTPTLNMIVTRSYPNLIGLMSILYLFSIVLIIVSYVKRKNKLEKPGLSFWILLGAILVAFYHSRGSSIHSSLKTSLFFMFTIIPFIIPQLVEVDAKKMIMAMAILPVFGVFYIPSIFLAGDSGLIAMDLTYSFLLPVISALVYLFVYYKEEDADVKKVMLPIMIVNFVYFFFCFLYGSRAPSLSVLLCLIFLLCTSISNKSVGYRFKIGTWFWLIIIIGIAMNFGDFLSFVTNVFSQAEIDSSALEKMNDLYKSGNLSDGRDAITEDAIRGISLSPIIGHGLSASEPFTGYQYPHNFVLQLLLDGGVILFLVVMVPMVFCLINGKKQYCLDEYALVCVLFFGSVPGALFSLDIWENPRFWLFMGFLLSKQFRVYSQNKFMKLKSL